MEELIPGTDFFFTFYWANNQRGSDALSIIIGIFRYFAEGCGGVTKCPRAKYFFRAARPNSVNKRFIIPL